MQTLFNLKQEKKKYLFIYCIILWLEFHPVPYEN